MKSNLNSRLFSEYKCTLAAVADNTCFYQTVVLKTKERNTPNLYLARNDLIAEMENSSPRFVHLFVHLFVCMTL